MKDGIGATAQSFYTQEKSPVLRVNQDTEESDTASEPEIEIGCSECPKLREKEAELQQLISEKTKVITDLESKIDQKLDIDVNSYQSKRLEAVTDEANRHFDNYIQV